MFFAAFPVANNCLDYLARTNIAEEAQGRAWGLIGFICNKIRTERQIYHSSYLNPIKACAIFYLTNVR